MSAPRPGNSLGQELAQANRRAGEGSRRSTRTCLVTSQYPPQLGGVGTSAARVAGLLDAAGMEVHVVAFEKHPVEHPFDECIATTREGRIVVHRVKVLHPALAPGQCEGPTLTRYNREMVQALDHLHQLHRFDVLHGFFLYPAGFVAGLVGHLRGVPVIASIRGNDVGKYALDPHRLPFVRVALENADVVTSVATDLIAFADRGVAPIAHKARTILNSVDPPHANGHAAPELGLTGMVVGTAGLFRYKKGLVYLFKALASLNGGIEYSMLLAGDYFHDDDRVTHERMIESYGLGPRTVVTGRIPRERMHDYLALFDVLVFPSLFSEGCPLSMLEAMAMGKAVIASRVAAIPEIVRDRENGLLVNPGSSAEIAAAIQELAQDPALRRHLGAEAARTAAAMNHEREAREWLDAYRAVRS